MTKLLEKFKAVPRITLTAFLAVIAFIVFVYYPVGMIWVSRIDDNPDFSAKEFEIEGGSHAVAMAAALMDREVNKHQWAASDPFFYPGSLLVRMPAFQRGIKDSIARFAIELFDQIGRTRGSSQADADLQKATGLFNYSPYVWLFDFSTSWLPTTSSQKQYRAAIDSLKSYNNRLSQKNATFDVRADNLIELLDRIASDLGSASGAIATRVDEGSTFSFVDNSDLYYHTKGRMYANYLLMKALREDFKNIIEEKQLAPAWDQMLSSLHDGMRLRNFMVINAAPDNALLPNHLAAEGFYVMRARLQLREITNILLK